MKLRKKLSRALSEGFIQSIGALSRIPSLVLNLFIFSITLKFKCINDEF